MNMKKLITFTIAFVISLACLADASDWPMFLNDAANSGYTSSRLETPLSPKWSFSAGAEITASPIKAGGKLFVATRAGNIFALNAYLGSVEWQYSTGVRIAGTPAFYNGKLFVNTFDGFLHCLDAETGNPVWSYNTLSQNIGSPTVYDGKVYFGTGHPHKSIVVLDAETGTFAWQNNIGQPVHSTPAVSGGMVWAGAGNGVIYGFNADSGQSSGQFRTDGTIYVSSPSIMGQKVFAAGGEFDTHAYAFSLQNAGGLWTSNPGENDKQVKISSFASHDDRAFACMGYPDQKIFAFDSGGGAVLWQHNLGSAENRNFTSTPVIADETVFACSAQGTLFAFNSVTGSQIAEVALGGPVVSSPAIAGGMIFIASYNGTVSAFYGADSTQPAAAISNPEQGGLAGYSISIEGTADDDNLQSYSVEFGAGENPLSWETITTVYGSIVKAGTLAVWEPGSELQSGVYSVRLTVTDVAGNTVSDSVTFNVDNDPPVFAGIVSVSSPDGSSAILDWDDATDLNGPIGYNIYTAFESGAHEYDAPLKTVAGATSTSVENLEAGRRVYFVVRAQDIFGNEDDNTVEISFQPEGIAAARTALFIPDSSELTIVPGGESDLDSLGRPTLVVLDSGGRKLIYITDTDTTEIPADGETPVEIGVNVFMLNGDTAQGVNVSVRGEITEEDDSEMEPGTIALPSASGKSITGRSVLAAWMEPAARVTGSLGSTTFSVPNENPGEFLLQVMVADNIYGPALRAVYAGVPLGLTDVHTYPNPWNDRRTAQMCFAGNLSGTADVTVMIYDIRGAKVRDIFAPAAQVGAATPDGIQNILACWDGTNNGARRLASGVYLYVLMATDGVSSIKQTGKFSIVH